MASKIDIFNLALGNVGVSETVADELEQSTARRVCSRYYDQALSWLMAYKSTPWGFATTRESLAKISDDSDLSGLTYAYPSDCVTIIAICRSGEEHGIGEEARRGFYQVEYGEQGRVIRTDISPAYAVYVRRIDEAERFPAYFTMALAMHLASMIAIPLTKKIEVGRALAQEAEALAQIAMAATLNERCEKSPLLSVSVYEQSIHS